MSVHAVDSLPELVIPQLAEDARHSDRISVSLKVQSLVILEHWALAVQPIECRLPDPRLGWKRLVWFDSLRAIK